MQLVEKNINFNKNETESKIPQFYREEPHASVHI